MFGRFVGVVVLVAAAVVLLAVSWPQLFSLQRADVVAQAVAMRGLVVALGLAAVVVFTLIALIARPARRFAASLAVVCLAFSGVGAAVLASRGAGGAGFPTKGESDVTVLSWNTLGGAPGARVVAELAADTDADIVALPETTRQQADDIADQLAELGIRMQAHTVAYDEISPARSTSVLIAESLGTYDVDVALETTSVLPTVIATPRDGSGPTIISVHAVAPLPGEMDNWRADLEWLAAACTGDVIMAGDFNATLDNFTGLESSADTSLGGCLDAASATGSAALGTWPTALPALLGSPIDHIMATDAWSVSAMRVVGSQDGSGSDHRPVLAQYAPAG